MVEPVLLNERVVTSIALGESHFREFKSAIHGLPGAKQPRPKKTIKEDICVGCNMCSLVCPVEGCITMQEVDTGKPPMSWNEYQAKLGAGEVGKIQPPGHV